MQMDQQALRELLEEDSSSRLEAIAEAQVERHWRPRIVSLTVALAAMTALVLYLFLDRSEVVGNSTVSTFRQWTPRPLQLFVEGQRDPEFSPDGSRIAFVAPVDGVAQLHVATVPQLLRELLDVSVVAAIGACGAHELLLKGLERLWFTHQRPQHVECDDVARALPDAVERRVSVESAHGALFDVAVAAVGFHPTSLIDGGSEDR